MEILLRIQANEIEAVPELTVYNSIMWKFVTPQLGLTHFKELYDDVNDYPIYHFGTLNDFGQFVYRVGFGGVWLEVTVQRPDLSFVVK